MTPKTHPIQSAPEDPFFADLRPRTLAQTIVHMGRRIEISPPVLSHAAIFSFFYRVEQDPENAAELMNVPASGAPAAFHMGPSSTAAPPPLVRPAKTHRPTLSSKFHDYDFSRLASCVDPYASVGLPALAGRNKLSGSWEGRFSFFDFDSYRDMLGGRIRSLYEGPFGDQPQVWKIEERIVRLKKCERQGGRGLPLNAGFEAGQPGPRPTQSPPAMTAMLPPPVPTTTPASPSLLSSASLRRKSVDGPGDWSPDQRATKRPRSVQEDVAEEDEDEGMEADEDDDGRYEILLTGSVRHSPTFCAVRRTY